MKPLNMKLPSIVRLKDELHKLETSMEVLFGLGGAVAKKGGKRGDVASFLAKNQAIIQGDRVNIQSRNSGNAGRNNIGAYVQEEIVEGSNAPNETENVQRTLRTSSSGNTSTVQCYNCSGKGHYARNCLKPRIQDSKYFMEQMLMAKQDEAGVILIDEQNDFLFADASRIEEIEELSENICLIARIQPADNTSDTN
ncbi:gag-pol polyprotein [Tanacetum coccineum]